MPHVFDLLQVATACLPSTHVVSQRVAHQKHWEVLLLNVDLLFLVLESVDECLLVELIHHAHVRVTWHVNTVELVVEVVTFISC